MNATNITINQFSELRGKFNEYWLNNALNGIKTWYFKNDFKDDNLKEDPKESREKLSRNTLLTRMEMLILQSLADGYYPFFEIDTEQANVTFSQFTNLNTVYQNMMTPNQDLFDFLFPDIITIKTFTQGTVFIWLN